MENNQNEKRNGNGNGYSTMEYDDEKRFKWTWKLVAAILFHLFGLLMIILAICTPWWIVSWSRIHTPLDRAGLWEFCLKGFILRTDISMKSYFGCWWIYAPEYNNIFRNLSPIWFIFVQLFVVIHLILYIIITLLFILYCLGYVWKRISNKTFTKILLTVCCVAGLCGLVSTILFAIFWSDPNWLPYPELNWPAFSYGANCAATACSFITAVFLIERILVEGQLAEEMEEEFRLLPRPDYSIPKAAAAGLNGGEDLPPGYGFVGGPEAPGELELGPYQDSPGDISEEHSHGNGSRKEQRSFDPLPGAPSASTLPQAPSLSQGQLGAQGSQPILNPRMQTQF